MKNSTYLHVSKVIEDEKKQKKVQKINLWFSFALACVVALLLGVGTFVIDFLSNFRIEYPVYYIVLLALIVIVLISFSIYAFPNNDFTPSELEVLERGRLRRYEFSLFKALGRKDYDSLKDFTIMSKEQLLETIDGLTEMDREYLEQFSPYATNSPSIEMPEALVTKHTRRDIITRSQERKKSTGVSSHWINQQRIGWGISLAYF